MVSEAGMQGLVGRPHVYDTTYRVVLDSAGPHLYRYFAPLQSDPDWVKRRIEYYLGEPNIKTLRTARWGENEVMVELELISREITWHSEVYSQSPNAVENDVRELLPPEHTESVTVTRSVDLGAHGPRR